DIFHNLPPECWNLVEPPKVLGDVFESLIGAIYVDSGMDNDIAKRYYDRLLSPFLDRFVDSGQLHNPDQMEFVNKHICDVKIHDNIVATAMGGSARHAKYNAGSAFLQLVGATAPNALSGDMRTANMMPERNSDDKETSCRSKLDKLLKPICTCLEIRRAEAAEAAAVKAAEAAALEAGETAANMNEDPSDLEEGELVCMDVDTIGT
ncbi:Dicer-like protein 1, partial [Coemansia sp. RSA 1285]